jgi:hypothetical protein
MAVAVRRSAFPDVRCTGLTIGVVGEDGGPIRNAAGATIRRGELEFNVHSSREAIKTPISEPRSEGFSRSNQFAQQGT